MLESQVSKNNKYIAVSGGVAVGKSTIIRHMSSYFAIALENSNNNPYIMDRKDYSNSIYYSQLYFLSQRFLSQLKLSQSKIALVERTIFEDAEIFAKYFHMRGDINDHQWEKYMGVYRSYCNIIQYPDLIIFIDSNLELTKNLIKKRGRASEENISNDFLNDVLMSYRQWIDLVNFCPVVRLHTEEIINKDYSYELTTRIKKSLPDFTELR